MITRFSYSRFLISIKLIPTLLQAVLAFCTLNSFVIGAEFSIDSVHSRVGFKIRHLGISSVSGNFKDFKGKFKFDESKSEGSSGEISIDTKSIHTGNEKRDKHLRSPDFFDVEKFPAIEFKSKKFISVGDKKYSLEGDLTMHGVKKPVKFDVELIGSTKDKEGKTVLGFTATSKLSRGEFGMTYGKPSAGDEVKLDVDIEAAEVSGGDKK